MANCVECSHTTDAHDWREMQATTWCEDCRTWCDMTEVRAGWKVTGPDGYLVIFPEWQQDGADTHAATMTRLIGANYTVEREEVGQ